MEISVEIMKEIMKEIHKIKKLIEGKQTKIMEELAEQGVLKIMKKLKKEECLWNKWACAYAAKNGNLKTLL